MLVSKSKVVPNHSLDLDDHAPDLDFRMITTFRPFLRVASRQQFDALSVPAQTLITSAELLSGTTFKRGTKKRAQALQSLQALARGIIGLGC